LAHSLPLSALYLAPAPLRLHCESHGRTAAARARGRRCAKEERVCCTASVSSCHVSLVCSLAHSSTPFPTHPFTCSLLTRSISHHATRTLLADTSKRQRTPAMPSAALCATSLGSSGRTWSFTRRRSADTRSVTRVCDEGASGMHNDGVGGGWKCVFVSVVVVLVVVVLVSVVLL
jgi:hypothetical protein